MSNGFPSMTALLGLLAVVGYQHRDKLAELLGGQQAPVGPDGATPPVPSGGLGGVLGQLGGIGGLGGSGSSSFLRTGLGELIERFTQNGHGDVAKSWVGHGPNQDISPDKLGAAIGPEILRTLSEKTGLSTAELLSRLSRELPSAVDRYTPEGQLPH